MIVRDRGSMRIGSGEGGFVSSRIGIVLQAIGVVALGSIVYMAFLSPEDPEPLTGIQVEDGVRITPPPIPGARRSDAQRVDPQRQGARRHNGPGKPRRHHRTRRSATFPRLVATPPSSSEVSPPFGDPPVKLPTDTPPGSQYEDSVSRILDMVGRPRP
jgi:hypothetical protein